MKTKSTTPLTPEQLAAKANAEAFFADLLAPAPKAAKPTKAATAAKVWRETSTKSIVQKSFAPEVRIHILTTQLCTTCNSEHTYMSSGIIRYTSAKRRDGLAIEMPSSVPASTPLVRRVEHRYEETDFCPTCFSMESSIDAILEAATEPRQLRLFS